MNNNSCENRIIRVFSIFFLIIFAYIFLYIIIDYNNSKLIFPAAFLITALCIIILGKCRDTINNLSDRVIYIILTATLFVLFLLLFKVGCYMQVPPFTDTGTVYYSVAQILETGHVSKAINEYTPCEWATHTSNNDYFLVYNSICFQLIYLLDYYKILGIFIPEIRTGAFLYTEAGITASTFFSSISITLSILFGFITVKKIGKNSSALLYLLMCFTFAPYYLNAYKAYSDTLSLPYVTLSLLLFVTAGKENSKKHYLLLALATFILSIGALIKGSLYIMIVAFIIFEIISKTPILKKCLSVAVIILVCISLESLWSIRLDNCNYIDTAEIDQFKLSPYYFIMMASVGDGGYRQEDMDYSLSFKTYEARKQANIDEFFTRVNSYGHFTNYLKFVRDKLCATLSDGLYCQVVHLKRTIQDRQILYDIIEGKYFPFLLLYTSIFSCIFYCSCLVASIRLIKHPETNIAALILICFFGFLLFFSFWEIRSRYFFNFVPLYCILTAFTVDEEASTISRKLNQKKKSSHNGYFFDFEINSFFLSIYCIFNYL